jgi:hypothetical protein
VVTPAKEWTDAWSRPTRLSGLGYRLKATILQAERLGRNWGSGLHRLKPAGGADFPRLLGLSRSPLWSDDREAEAAFQRGKVQNLRCAVRSLNGVLLPVGETFRFWRQTDPARRCATFWASDRRELGLRALQDKSSRLARWNK